MTTILLVIAGFWVLVSLLFCVALGMAAAKPMPQMGDTQQVVELDRQAVEHQGEARTVALMS
jgi:hypothetical protein